MKLPNVSTQSQEASLMALFLSIMSSTKDYIVLMVYFYWLVLWQGLPLTARLALNWESIVPLIIYGRYCSIDTSYHYVYAVMGKYVWYTRESSGVHATQCWANLVPLVIYGSYCSINTSYQYVWYTRESIVDERNNHYHTWHDRGHQWCPSWMNWLEHQMTLLQPAWYKSQVKLYCLFEWCTKHIFDKSSTVALYYALYGVVWPGMTAVISRVQVELASARTDATVLASASTDATAPHHNDRQL